MIFKNERLRICLLTSALFGMSTLALPVQAATFVVINNDGAGEGFNDPTPIAPVGGNTGTTIGGQRLIAFQAAANIWGGLLSSSVTIRVGAQFNPLTCNDTSAILGSAGATTSYRDFTGAPFTATWYAVALANALHGSDLDADDDIHAQFNSNIGTTGCLSSSGWYYGLDGNPPSGSFDFVTVLLHELGHGLGFATLVNLGSGAKALGYNDAFMLNLENHGASPPDYPSMSDAQRVAASTATGNLHWIGAHVRAASGVLTAGKVGDHVRMFAPNPQQPGSSVSHWDTALTPNQLMEPSYTMPIHSPGLELPAFQDIGWTLLSPTVKATHDFDGNGKSDLLFRNSTTGAAVAWLMNGGTVASSGTITTVASAWQIVAQRDFDGDGKADLLWRNTSTGALSLWLMNGVSVKQVVSVGTIATTWVLAGASDFDGDGKADLLWRNSSTGAVAIWLMNGATVKQSGSLGTVASAWVIVGTDAKGHILWRNSGSGAITIWDVSGITVSQTHSLGTVATTWSIVGIGDFDGNGSADLLFRNTSTGATAIWLLNNGVFMSSASLGTVALSWSADLTGDFDGGGKSNILWTNSNGARTIWFMNGGAVTSTASLGTVATGWHVQSTGAE